MFYPSCGDTAFSTARRRIDPGALMNNFFDNWLEAIRFSCEAQSVIATRLMLLASGAPNALEEAVNMVAEKVLVFAKAGIAAEQALEDGRGIYAAAELAYLPVQRCVHDNSDRLLHGFH